MLLQYKPCTAANEFNKNKIQIVFCNDQKHWIIATTVGCETGEVKVYDSIFSSLDKESLQTVMKLFSSGNNKPRVRLSPSQKQTGSNDCSVFAICHATAIVFGLNPTGRNEGPLSELFQQRIFSLSCCIVDYSIYIMIMNSYAYYVYMYRHFFISCT